MIWTGFDVECEAEPELDATTNEPRMDLATVFFLRLPVFYKYSWLFPREIIIDLNQLNGVNASVVLLRSRLWLNRGEMQCSCSPLISGISGYVQIHPHRSKQTDLKEAPWAVNSGLYEADAVWHFRRVRICIRTCRSCIERVANAARHYREIRSHVASVPLRRQAQAG